MSKKPETKPPQRTHASPKVALGLGQRRLSGWLVVLCLSALVLGPLAFKHVLLLDWANGPNPAVDPTVFGKAVGTFSSIPFTLLLVGLIHWLGPSLTVTMAIFGFIALAVFSGRRARERPFSWIHFSLLLVLNPFVADRVLAGHFSLLLGLGCLSWLLLTLFSEEEWGASWRLPLIMSAAIAFSPHLLFIGGLSLVVAAPLVIKRLGIARVVKGLAIFVLMEMYWILPSYSARFALDAVNLSDLKAFSNGGVSLWEIIGLYGFWRPEWPLTKASLPGWILILGAILVVVLGGVLIGGMRKELRPWVAALLIAAPVGLVLALGGQGPFGALYLWAFENLPGFKVMREPQKFLGIAVIAYAMLYGIGSDWLVRGARGRLGKITLSLLLAFLPCLYSYNLLWGFKGYLEPSREPQSWSQARMILRDGDGKVLALPWHQYLAFSWTQNRVVANPMSSYFERETIVGDNIEVGDIETQSTNPRSKYLEDVMARWMDTKNFGNLVAPLGIKYILLAKEADWMDYRWLEQQEDIRLVEEWDDLRLYENIVPAPVAYSTDRKITFRNMDELVAAAAVIRLTDYAIEIDPSAKSPPPDLSPANAGPVRVKKHSPVNYEFLEPGKGGYVVFTESFDPEWAIDDERAKANLGATNFFEVAPQEGIRIKFMRWRLMVVGYSISGATLAGILLYWRHGVVHRRRRVGNELAPVKV